MAEQAPPPPQEAPPPPKLCRRRWAVADYSHRRPKMAQKRPGKAIDRRREQYYYGIKSTNVTEHLAMTPPSHAYHPALREAAPPSYHRKSSEITESVMGPIHVPRFDPSQPSPWFNRQATDVTEQLRFVPPAHAASEPAKPDPWYGRTRTYVTNPAVDDYSVKVIPNTSKVVTVVDNGKDSHK